MTTRVAGDLYESLTRQLFEIGRQLGQPNGYPFDPVKLQKFLRDALEGQFYRTPSNCYLATSVTVDYSLSVEEAVRMGKYDRVSVHITDENFPHQARAATKVLHIFLVQYGFYMRIKEILTDFDVHGLRALKLPGLLALGSQNPDLQRQFPIVALGPVWQHPTNGDHDDCFVPCLYGSDAMRELNIIWSGGKFHSGYCFAAVSK